MWNFFFQKKIEIYSNMRRFFIYTLWNIKNVEALWVHHYYWDTLKCGFSFIFETKTGLLLNTAQGIDAPCIFIYDIHICIGNVHSTNEYLNDYFTDILFTEIWKLKFLPIPKTENVCLLILLKLKSVKHRGSVNLFVK